MGSRDANRRPYGFLASGWKRPSVDTDTDADTDADDDDNDEAEQPGGGMESQVDDESVENAQVDPSQCPLAASLLEAERSMESDPSVARLTLEALLQEAPAKGASARTRGAALAALARMYETGAGQVVVNRTHAVELYREAATYGNATAQFRMGTLYAAGRMIHVLCVLECVLGSFDRWFCFRFTT
jgi:TPR repeat protein